MLNLSIENFIDNIKHISQKLKNNEDLTWEENRARGALIDMELLNLNGDINYSKLKCLVE